MITLEKMEYISLDFSFSPLNFTPFLGIDHLENVSMRYRYPKVLGYRVLGIDIDPALVSNHAVRVSPYGIMKLLKANWHVLHIIFELSYTTGFVEANGWEDKDP